MGNSKDGRVRLGSQNDKGLRGGDDGKTVSHTTVKTGSFRRGGDNSSEECIVDSYGKEGIRAVTEVRVERDDEESVRGSMRTGGNGNPFRDQKMMGHAV